MFFNSVEEINRSRKEINRLLSKGMSNIYLKVTMRYSQNFDFLGLKNVLPGQFLGELQLTQISLLNIYIHTHTHTHTNLPVSDIVGLPHPWSGDSQGQETFLAPSADKQTCNYDTECSNYMYIYIIHFLKRAYKVNQKNGIKNGKFHSQF